MLLVFIILAFIFPPVGIPVLIIYFLTHKKENVHPSQNKDQYLQLALSKEDAISQWFLLLSVFFLGITLLIYNRDLGDPLNWRTIMFLTSVTGLAITYYFKTLSTLIVSLIGIASWWGIQSAQWIQGKEIKTSSILAGIIFIALLFYVLGHYHDKELKYKRFSFVYLIFGIMMVTGALFIFSSKIGLGMLAEMTQGALFLGSWEVTVSLLLLFVTLVCLTLYLASKKLILLTETAAIFSITFLFGITAFLPHQAIFMKSVNYLGSSSELSAIGILWAIVFNFAVFFELLGLIFSGYFRKEEWLINTGTLFLFLLIIVKYFDWFFTFLDKSLFFIGAGILLFVVGWFMEKNRRYMIANIKTE